MDYPKEVWIALLVLLITGVALTGLKLFGVIATSWWLVLLPFAPVIILPLILLWAIWSWVSSGGR